MKQTGRFMSVVAAFNDAALRCSRGRTSQRAGCGTRCVRTSSSPSTLPAVMSTRWKAPSGTELLAVVPAVTPDGEGPPGGSAGRGGRTALAAAMGVHAGRPPPPRTRLPRCSRTSSKQTVVSRGTSRWPRGRAPIVLPPDATPTMEGRNLRRHRSAHPGAFRTRSGDHRDPLRAVSPARPNTAASPVGDCRSSSTRVAPGWWPPRSLPPPPGAWGRPGARPRLWDTGLKRGAAWPGPGAAAVRVKAAASSASVKSGQARSSSSTTQSCGYARRNCRKSSAIPWA